MNGWGGTLYVDRFELSPAGGGSKRYIGSSLVNGGAPDLSGGANANGMQAAFDDGNTLGVTATEGLRRRDRDERPRGAGPLGRPRGGWTGGTLRVMASDRAARRQHREPVPAGARTGRSSLGSLR